MEDNTQNKNEEFYIKLKEELNKVEKFPTDFTYKFIVPTEKETITQIQNIFKGISPKFQTKESKNGKYTSITVIIYAIDADQIINYYKEVGKIKGVIML